MLKGTKWLIGLVMLGLLICTSTAQFASATPTTTILITDRNKHCVIEVDADHNIIWQYGQRGINGSGPNQLYHPEEAVRLTNGNTLIADALNFRVIEVTPAKNIVWEYKGPGGPFSPNDVKKLPNGNVLITDHGTDRVLEIQPIGTSSGTIVWRCGTGTNIPLKYPIEAEKRPGTPTPYYLITDFGNHCVIEVQAQGASGGTIVWQYGETGVYGNGTNQLSSPWDAQRLVCGNILIADRGNERVIEVKPTGTSGGTIVWECSSKPGLKILPFEAIRMSNWNTLIGVDGRVIEVRTNDYPNFSPESIVWQHTGIGYPLDIEEVGIVNIAKAEYQDFAGKDMPRKFAGVVIPLLMPIIEGPPDIHLTKEVSPTGTQTIGATLTYTIKYENTGTGTAYNVKITDMVPDGTEYIVNSAVVKDGPSATIEYSHDGGLNFDDSQSAPVTHVRWSIPEVGPGESGTLEFKVQIK